MANKMLLDDTRSLRREQREALIARKRERREARAFKREHQTIELETLALQTIDIAPSRPPVDDPTPVAETAPQPARSPVTAPWIEGSTGRRDSSEAARLSWSRVTGAPLWKMPHEAERGRRFDSR